MVLVCRCYGDGPVGCGVIFVCGRSGGGGWFVGYAVRGVGSWVGCGWVVRCLCDFGFGGVGYGSWMNF